jgi:ABC-type uncharacterized transport system ATPase subunit
MVGGEVPGLAPRSGVAPRPAFAARALSAGGGAHALRVATFEVRGGEIVGIAGVEGNGQSALTDAIAGMLPYEGEMTLGEQPLRGDPAARIAAGVRIIPQDRQREGLVLGWSIVDNVALGDQTRPPLARGWTIDRARAPRSRPDRRALRRSRCVDPDERRIALGRQPAKGRRRAARSRTRRASSSPISRRAASTSAPRRSSSRG